MRSKEALTTNDLLDILDEIEEVAIAADRGKAGQGPFGKSKESLHLGSFVVNEGPAVDFNVKEAYELFTSYQSDLNEAMQMMAQAGGCYCPETGMITNSYVAGGSFGPADDGHGHGGIGKETHSDGFCSKHPDEHFEAWEKCPKCS